MRTSTTLFLLLFMFSALNAQNTKSSMETEPMETGIYEGSWESLKQYGEAPEWFQDAKFGIWAHWGPQCEPEDGDWYARAMYFPGSGQYNTHVSKYGNPSVFGFKDVINVWKADKWDPEKLVALFKRTGAQYFMALANHHDNMDLWDSKYQPWNSVNMGPKRDILGEWAKAAKDNKLPFGISIHASHAWTWYEGSQDFDGNLTKEDGAGKWWEGYDPQDLYAQNHPRSEGSSNIGNIHKQWNWEKGAAQPSEEFCNNVYNRTIDAINRYNPDVVYFDDTVLPFYPINNDIGPRIAAHAYNKSLKENGSQKAVILGKVLNEDQKECMVWDIERAIPDKIEEKYWQTCTCIGTWHYQTSFYDDNRYKSAKTVIYMLVDIVSKNGNLLLSVPMRGNGTIDDKEEAILKGISDWMDINKESIYGTRPWKVFGEGPTNSGPIRDQGFNEGLVYTSKDIRYVEKNDVLYATVLGWPDDRKVTLKNLGTFSPHYTGKVKKVELLGYGKVNIVSRNEDGLTVKLPAKQTNDIAPVLKISL
ncbi:alpha-L-fucosidase [Dysgonomonas sp. 216]|uniref:alpha-L-fucosidase n=1 Tax=Dysgonomonas sp. 216 TaxID=2302934 RepID=UPI0013D44822|nr:alpha-L-fucosidase [Dysgonomonas sp. 216]NDW17639.1 alpha-L-fucosidase [Dysgonomonas sp. 216]